VDHFVQVRIVLRTERERGGTRADGRPLIPFDQAWYRALRQILPPEECPDELRADYEDTREMLTDTKPWWRAAYDRLPEPAEDEVQAALEREAKRNADMVEAAEDPELIAA